MSTDLLSFDCRFQYGQGFTLESAFALPPGISVLFGPSGSGKSTCLSLIAGLLRPDAGAIRLCDTPLVDRVSGLWVPPHRRRLGVVFQDHLLFPHQTIRRNLGYGMASRDDNGTRLGSVVEMLDLGGLLDRYPAQLSGGEQRRVALGRAMLSEPRLLLMDEPLTGLDEAMRDRILHHLHQVHERLGVPMLLVSHDQVVVRRMAGHVVVLEEGRVVDQGPAHETLDRATTRTMASHPGPINLLRVEEVRRSGDHHEGVIAGQPFHLAGPIAPDSTAVYVRCLPRDVALLIGEGEVPRISMRNHLVGTIRDLIHIPGDHRALVAVDVGQLIWVEVTESACQELNLATGVRVTCLIKALATDIVG